MAEDTFTFAKESDPQGTATGQVQASSPEEALASLPTDARKDTGVIDSSSLAPEPEMKLTQPKPATEAAGLGGQLEGMISTQDELAQQEADLAKQRDEITGVLSDRKGEIERTAEQYAQEGGVDEIQKELDNINQQIREEQHRLRRQLERLEKNPEGLFQGGLQQEMKRVERESLKKQADLSIIQMGIQGRFDSAKTIADRAVAMQMEQQRNETEALMFNYQENKELFTKKEQRAFETAQRDRERALDRQERELQQISDFGVDALKNGAPPSVVTAMMNAETPEQAIAIGGQYIGKYERLTAIAQLNKITSASSAGKPMTSAQFQVLNFGKRMLNSSTLIDEMATKFSGAGSAVARNRFFPNAFKSADLQQFEQAERDFINAVLRRESGAAIGKEEFASAKEQYIPQPGDTEEVLLRKKITRDMVTEGFLLEAGQDVSFLRQSIMDPLDIGSDPAINNPLGL